MKKKSSVVSLSAPFNEAKWQAQRDLDTLLEAKRIEADPKRCKAAKAQAKNRKEELAEQLGDIAVVEADKDSAAE